jgi:hypothetical protein
MQFFHRAILSAVRERRCGAPSFNSALLQLRHREQRQHRGEDRDHHSDSVGIAAPAVATVTVTFDVEALFAGVASACVAVTVAVFATGPAVEGAVTMRVMLIDAPDASEAVVQVTVAVPLHVP